MFQFTHPGKGATRERAEALSQKLVSIHAPWEGCDFARYLPRCEGRFQFTHPGKGATSCPMTSACQSFSFNSRTLGRVRLPAAEYNKALDVVSIHAPWEGCDFAEP